MPEIKLIPRNPIRAALGVLGVVLTFTLWSIFVLLRKLFFLPPSLDSKLIGLCSKGVMASLELKIKIFNREIYNPNEPAIIIANHSSQIDIPLIYESTSYKVRMLSKREMFWFPIMGWAMLIAKFIPVHRGRKDSGAKARATIASRLKEGYQIFMAPEGTRSATGCLLPFKKGAFHLSFDHKVPIYVLALYRPWEVLPKGKLYSSHTAELEAHFLGRIEPINRENSVKSVEELLGEARKLYLSHGFVEC